MGPGYNHAPSPGEKKPGNRLGHRQIGPVLRHDELCFGIFPPYDVADDKEIGSELLRVFRRESLKERNAQGPQMRTHWRIEVPVRSGHLEAALS